MKLTREQILIQNIKSKLGNKVIGDDCARIQGETLVSCDTLVDGTHFISSQIRMRDLGWKAMAVNLSDIAAMGGRPRYSLVALTLPSNLRENLILELYDGLIDCAHSYRTTIVGGDITYGPALTIGVTIIGDVHESGCLYRSGAKEGDVVAVTGDFGASAAGLKVLQKELAKNTKGQGQTHTAELGLKAANSCVTKHIRPIPRLPESWSLIKRTGRRGALMDASDGLADALVQIATASNVGMTVDLNLVPISQETKDAAHCFHESCFDWALYGGEDYELVACLPEAVWQSWQSEGASGLCPFKIVGRVTDSKVIYLTFGKEPGPQIDLGKTFQHIRDTL
jgi:thiamine-monophosphate kinase